MMAARLRSLPAPSSRAWLVLVVALGLAAAVALFALRAGPSRSVAFEEMKLPSRADVPVAIAASRDGTIWFTLDSSTALGRLRNGQLEKVPKGVESIEPLGLAVDAEGRAWYTEAPRQAIARASPDGTIESFALRTPVARLGRLCVGPDGAVWFAEPTVMSATRLKDGVFTRHILNSLTSRIPADAAPFGIAVAPDGAVWMTLPSANKLLRFVPGGEATVFDVPTRQSNLGDIAVGADGTVYFLELSANKIGRIAGGRIEEFAVPTPLAGVTALAVAPDGAAWFTELRGHRLGRLHNGTITEFELPRSDARPFGIAVAGDGKVWYADLSGWIGRLELRGTP
jgi:virginiamycin B lyase